MTEKIGVRCTVRRGEFSTNTIEETASYLLDVHVPDDRENEDTKTQKVVMENSQIALDTADAPFVTEQEIVRTVRTFKNNKVRGHDLVEVNVLKAACRVIPSQIVSLFNGCLQ